MCTNPRSLRSVRHISLANRRRVDASVLFVEYSKKPKGNSVLFQAHSYDYYQSPRLVYSHPLSCNMRPPCSSGQLGQFLFYSITNNHNMSSVLDASSSVLKESGALTGSNDELSRAPSSSCSVHKYCTSLSKRLSLRNPLNGSSPSF